MARRREGDSSRTAGKRRLGGEPFHRRHRRLLSVVAALALVIVGGSASYAYYLNSKFGNFGRVSTDTIEDRPDPDDGKALNILLLGSDKGEKVPGASADTTIEQDAAAKKWPSGKYRSDTIMLVHIPEDRSRVYLVSIPRDTYTDIDDATGATRSTQKINAAFSEYGPNGAIATVENLTGLRMDHLAIIDWDGFRDITRAVGGVEVHIATSFYDPQQKIQWQAGDQVLEGNRALQYVRTRYGLLRGDFDRIARQQNFMRSLMKKMLSRGVTTNPVKLANTVDALSKNMTIDEDWSTGSIRSLALSLRGITAEDVTFLTAPVAGTETLPVVGSIVRLDEVKSRELWTALANGTVDDYVAKYPDDLLKSDREIS